MPSPGMDTSDNEKHGIKPHTWGLENHLFFFKTYIYIYICSNSMFFFKRLQAIYLTHGQGEKIILQTVLGTGSNSCVWGRQSLAKIGKKESFSTGHPNNSGGRSAASICNKALAVSCKSFWVERLRSFLAWGWSWLDMTEASPGDGTYFRRSLDRISFFGVNRWSNEKKCQIKWCFQNKLFTPGTFSVVLDTHALFLKGNVLQGTIRSQNAAWDKSRFRRLHG